MHKYAIDRSINKSISWLAGGLDMNGWLDGWLVGWMDALLAYWLVGLLAGWLAERLVDWLMVDLLAGCRWPNLTFFWLTSFKLSTFPISRRSSFGSRLVTSGKCLAATFNNSSAYSCSFAMLSSIMTMASSTWKHQQHR